MRARDSEGGKNPRKQWSGRKEGAGRSVAHGIVQGEKQDGKNTRDSDTQAGDDRGKG